MPNIFCIDTATTIQHRGKTSAHASTSLKFALRTWCQVFRMLSKTQNGRANERLRSFAFSGKMLANNKCDNLKTRNNYILHVREILLCKKITKDDR